MRILFAELHKQRTLLLLVNATYVVKVTGVGNYYIDFTGMLSYVQLHFICLAARSKKCSNELLGFTATVHLYNVIQQSPRVRPNTLYFLKRPT